MNYFYGFQNCTLSKQLRICIIDLESGGKLLIQINTFQRRLLILLINQCIFKILQYIEGNKQKKIHILNNNRTRIPYNLKSITSYVNIVMVHLLHTRVKQSETSV